MELAYLTMAVEHQLWGRLSALDLLDLLQDPLSPLAARVQSDPADRAALAVNQYPTARPPPLETTYDDAVQLQQVRLLPARPFGLVEHHRNVVKVAQAGWTSLFLQRIKANGQCVVFSGGIQEQGHALLQQGT